MRRGAAPGAQRGSRPDLLFALSATCPLQIFAKSGVQLIQQTITKIDPGAKRVITDEGSYTTDYLVVALGADTMTGMPRPALPR
jgi:NADPH-dependent 2,4-dienoyl-CoA reductase/sulfur reductase-like enzyme